MEKQTTPPRWGTRAAIDGLTRLLGLPGLPETSQDWSLEVACHTRLAEFCDLYEGEALEIEMQFALMGLIIASLDEAPWGDAKTEAAVRRVDRLLRRDFTLHIHTIYYWCLLNEDNPKNVFPVTPMMRCIWVDCFKPEYQIWFEAD